METETFPETQATDPQLWDTEGTLNFSSDEEETAEPIHSASVHLTQNDLMELEKELLEVIPEEEMIQSQILSSQRDMELEAVFGEDSDEESRSSVSSQATSNASSEYSASDVFTTKKKGKKSKSRTNAKEKSKNTAKDRERYGGGAEPTVAEDEEEEREEKEAEDENEDEDGKEKLKNDVELNHVVQSEIEVIKRIEQGPSQAELRRRQLIEIDEEELEEKIEQLNKRGLEIISQSTGLTKEQRKQRLVECRSFLSRIWKSEKDEDIDHAEFIEMTMEKQYNRLYGYEAEVPFDALEYLERENYSSDEEETEKMISLSDSEEDEEDEDDSGGNTTDQSISPPQGSRLVAAEIPATKSNDPRIQFRQYFFQKHKQQQLVSTDSRASLLFSLRQKVHEAAIENYCHQKKIAKEDLQMRLEISERCRQLVEILKEQFEERAIKEREERRAKYQSMAADEDEEFDDNNLPEGQFLTEEEKAMLLRNFEADFDEEEEEEEEEQENDEEEGEMDVIDSIDRPEAVLEEIEANDQLAENDDKIEVRCKSDEKKRELLLLSRQASNSTVEDDLDDGEGEEGEEEEDGGDYEEQGRRSDLRSEEEEEEHAPIFHRKSGSKSLSQSEAIDSDQEFEEQSKPKYNTGLKNVKEGEYFPSEIVDPQGKDASKEEAHQEQAEEEEEVEAKNRNRRKKVSTGNALFRLQLQEEERQLRQKKGGSFFDDEAEEEEEEGYQAGLGDFGFGVTSKLKESEEENDALKLRKGDLDHIVDSISDDEGDEEEAMKIRAELERKEDKDRTRMVITAVTEGHDALKQRSRKLGFSFEELVGKSNPLAGAGEQDDNAGGEDVGAGEEELDEEEMLQRGLKEKVERERQFRKNRGGRGSSGGGAYGNESDEDDDGEEEEGYNTEEEIERMKELFSTMTEEEKKIEIENLQKRKETERLESLRRKQMEKEFKIRRELRLQARRSQNHSQTQSQSQPSFSLPSAYVLPSLDSSVGGATMMNPPIALKDITNKAVNIIHSEASNPFARASSWNVKDSGMNASRKSQSINAVSQVATQATAPASKGLFSLVTSGNAAGGYNSAMSGTGIGNNNHNPLKRSFSSIFQNKKMPSNNKSQKTSHYSVGGGSHFVFMEQSNHGASMPSGPPGVGINKTNNTLIDGSTMGSNPPLVRQGSTGSSNQSQVTVGSSLFDKLGSKTGMLKRSHTISKI